MEQKNSALLEEVLIENKHKIYRICSIYACAPYAPEDLFQEVTYQIWKSLPNFKKQSSLNTWVYRIALNVAMKFKSKKENEAKTIQLDAVQIEDKASQSENDDKLKALYACIRHLKEPDQTLVILYLDNLPYKTIAEITGLSENHIAVKMKRIRALLLNCLNKKCN